MDKKFATESLRQYPWLRDFCSYLDKEEKDWLDYYLIHAEVVWINKLANWKMEPNSSNIEAYYGHENEAYHSVMSVLVCNPLIIQ